METLQFLLDTWHKLCDRYAINCGYAMSTVRKNIATWQYTGQLQASTRCQVESAVTPRASPVHREQVPGYQSSEMYQREWNREHYRQFSSLTNRCRAFDKWRIMKQLFSRV